MSDKFKISKFVCPPPACHANIKEIKGITSVIATEYRHRTTVNSLKYNCLNKTFKDEYKKFSEKCARGCKGRQLLYNHVKSTLSRIKHTEKDLVSYDFADTKVVSLKQNRLNEIDNKTFTEKIKSVRERFKNIGIQFKDKYCVENVNVCHRGLLNYFQLMSVELEKDLHAIRKKDVKKVRKNIKKVKITVNRKIFDVDDVEETELEQSVKLIQRILRGRTYQTMMLLAELRYKQFLDNNFSSKSTLCAYSSPAAANKEKRADGSLERLKNKFISNYFDAITKEFVMKQFNARWIKEFNELVQRRHFVETMETNRRVNEIIARGQNDEKFKQVMKIHSDVSDLLFETVMENACTSAANDVAVKTIERIIDGYVGHQLFTLDNDEEYSDNLYSYRPLRLCCYSPTDINP